MNISENKVVAIHQPNFLPWLGYLEKMDLCDIFILLDKVQYSHGSLINRVKILSNKKTQFLTVPVHHVGSLNMEIGEIKINHTAKFVKKATSTLFQNYNKQPYWKQYGEPIVEIIRMKHGFLIDLNLDILRFLADSLRIPWSKIRMQSKLPFHGQKSDLIASLVQSVGGNTYLSGGRDPGDAPTDGKTGTAADYNDPAIYAEHDIALKYQNFVHPEYDQGLAEFFPGLSAFDALVRFGGRTMEIVRTCNNQVDLPGQVERYRERD